MSITMIALGLVEYRHYAHKSDRKTVNKPATEKRDGNSTYKVDSQYLEVLKSGPKTSPEISVAMSRSIKAVQGHMIKLEKRGLVTMLGYRKGRSNPAKLWAATNAKA